MPKRKVKQKHKINKKLCNKKGGPLTIADLKTGEKFKVKKITLSKEIGKRLADMGFTHGVEGEIIRCALLGDPLQIHILHYQVSIRKSEALGIEVEKIEGENNNLSLGEQNECQ